MKRLVKIGLITGVLLMLVIAASGCVSSPTTTPAPTDVPTATPTATPTAKATATKTPTATPAASDSTAMGIETNLVSKGYTIVSSFKKTSVDGRTAYKGSATDGDYTYSITAILTGTQSEAISLYETKLAEFKAQGYTTKDSSKTYSTILSKGDTLVGVMAYKEIYGTGSPGTGILEASY
jgi:hypothetical protein